MNGERGTNTQKPQAEATRLQVVANLVADRKRPLMRDFIAGKLRQSRSGNQSHHDENFFHWSNSVAPPLRYTTPGSQLCGQTYVVPMIGRLKGLKKYYIDIFVSRNEKGYPCWPRIARR